MAGPVGIGVEDSFSHPYNNLLALTDPGDRFTQPPGVVLFVLEYEGMANQLAAELRTLLPVDVPCALWTRADWKGAEVCIRTWFLRKAEECKAFARQLEEENAKYVADPQRTRGEMWRQLER